MLKKRDLYEVPALFELLNHKDVYPYVRQKAASSDEFYFITKQTIEAEENGELVSRTILDEYETPIGTINLFDIQQGHGFLATWIGQPYFGNGYNKRAKELFFEEVFSYYEIEGIYMKIQKTNTRSLNAALKLPYAALANNTHPEIYAQINVLEDIYDLFIVSKEHYTTYYQFARQNEATSNEDVS